LKALHNFFKELQDSHIQLYTIKNTYARVWNIGVHWLKLSSNCRRTMRH